MAHPSDLDGGALPRTRAHSDTIAENLELGQAWDDFGLVADIVVSITCFISTYLLLIYNMFQPFTNDFPRADIHELLSPDILHKVIKGTFKDHLVTWVEEYLTRTYDASTAKDILSDIDRRYVLLKFYQI